MKADQLHRRAPLHSSSIADEVKKKSTSVSVPININIGTSPVLPEEYGDFYPLHVTKVAVDRRTFPVIWLIGVAIILGVGFLAGWLVNYRNQSLSESEASSSDSRNTNQTPSGSTAGSIYPKYTNSAHGFSLQFPESWKEVKVENVADTSSSASKPLDRVTFSLPSKDLNASEGRVTLLRLRIDTEDSFNRWQAEVKGASGQSPIKVGQSRQSIVSIEYSLGANDAPKDLQSAIKDLPSVLQSFVALN